VPTNVNCSTDINVASSVCVLTLLWSSFLLLLLFPLLFMVAREMECFLGGDMCRISFLKHIAQSLAKLGSAGVTCRKVPYQASSF